MRYSFISAAALAFASTVYAQTGGFDVLTAPVMGQTAAAGSSLDIVWTPTAGYNNDTVTITLLQGDTPATLQLGPVVKAGIASYLGTYSWPIPSTTAPFATYGFKLSLDAEDTIFQYSFPFHISGLTSTSSSSATGSATSTTTVSITSNSKYTASTTSSHSSSSSSIVSTTSSSSSASTTSSSSSSMVSTSSVVVSSTPTPSGSPSSTPSAAATPTTNAAGNVVSGGMAMVGGLIVALAL